MKFWPGIFWLEMLVDRMLGRKISPECEARMLDAPEDVIQGWTTAWNDGDAVALGALFAEDADFVNVVGLWWHDRAAIQAAHAYGFEQIFTGSTITMTDQRVRHLGTSAVVQARWAVQGQQAHNGVSAGVRHGVFTFVMHHFDAGWLCVAAQNTDIVPNVETHIVTDGGIQAVDYRQNDTE